MTVPLVMQRETEHTSTHGDTLQAEISVKSPHHRDTMGKSGRGVAYDTSNFGDSIPSYTHTQQQVPEIKRKSEEKR